MNAYIFLVAWLVVGLAALLLIPMRLRLMEYLAGGIVLGITLGSWVTFITSGLLGVSAGILLSLSAAVGVSGFIAWRRERLARLVFEDGERRRLFQILEYLFLGVLVLVCVMLMYRHSFLAGVGGLYSGGYTWADLALHTTLATYFAESDQIVMQFPIYPGQALSYPFLTDFFSGMLLRLGASLQMAMGLPGILLIGSAIVLSYSAARRLLASTGAALLHIWLVVTTSSLVGFWYFFQNLSQSDRSIFSVIREFDYSQLTTQFDGANLVLVNFVTSHLLPQRSFLAGFALSCLIFLQISQLVRGQSKAFWPLGVAIGLLPLIHTHSFFVLILLIIALWLHTAYTKNVIKNSWLTVLGIALCFALPQLLWQISTTLSEGFIRPNTWWMADGYSGWFFWLRNAGFLVVALLAAPFIARFARLKDDMQVISLVALLLFAACNLFVFQPNDWDNMKFLSWVFWFANLFFVWTLVWFVQNTKGLVKAFAVVLTITCVVGSSLTGVLALSREFDNDYVLASVSDQAFAELVKEKTSPTDVILTSQRHNHPVSMLAGRTIVLGYTGWLWTYGIQTDQRQQDVRTMFAGTAETAALLRAYNIKFVAVSSYELREIGFNPAYYLENAELVAATPDGVWRLFAVNGLGN